jgi:NitT/TauT family transport system substrate-binding protein
MELRKWIMPVVLTLSLVAPALAADKLTVATGGFSPSVPPFVSFAKPHLLKQELDIEDVLMNSGTLAAQTLASGQVKIIVTTSAVVPQFNLSGGDMVIVAGTINKLPYQIVARGEIKTPALLKGKRVAISRFGSSSEWLVRLALTKMGLDPDKDVTIMQIGGQSERFAAMQSNTVQATLLGPPTSTVAVRKMGMVQLADFTEYDTTYPLQSVITTRTFLKENRPLVKRFLRGLGLAFRHYREQPQDGIAFQAKQFKLPADLAEAGYRSSAKVMEPDLKLPDNAALDIALKEIAGRIEKARTVTVQDLRLTDDSVRQELIKEGLFKIR